MNTNVEFLNKNWYRKYPLRATSEYKDAYGNTLPLSLFAGANLSVYSTYVDAFINKIVIKQARINVTVSARTQTGITALGYFDAQITQSNQVLHMVAIQPFASGHLVIGDASVLTGLDGAYILDYTNGKIEDSLIFSYPPPAVVKIVHGQTEVTGFLNFTFENLTQVTSGQSISFTVDNKDLTTPNFFRTVGTLSCLNPIITGINSVVPDENGNIDIFAIQPLAIDIDEGAGRITLSIPDEGVRANMCEPAEIIPCLITSDVYKGYRPPGDVERDPLKTAIPEWNDKFPVPACNDDQADQYVWPSREGAV